MKEYPVLLRVKCSYGKLLSLLREANEPEHYFALRRLRMEKISMELPELLEVTAVLSSVVINREAGEVRSPDFIMDE